MYIVIQNLQHHMCTVIQHLNNVSCFPLRGEHMFMPSQNMEIFSQAICTDRKDWNVEARQTPIPLSTGNNICVLHHNTSTNKPDCHHRPCFYCSALLSSHIPEGDVKLNVYLTPCWTFLSAWSTGIISGLCVCVLLMFMLFN